MHDPNCIFCKIIKKEIPVEIVYEDDNFISFLDIGPNNFGHTLILPKKHFENLYTWPKNILREIGEVVQKVSVAVKKATNADGLNVIMNNESAAGQVVFHSHIHIVPRLINDGFKWWPHKEYENPEKMKETGDKIRKAISS